MKIIVAGSTSYIAKEFIDIVSKKYDVIALVRSLEKEGKNKRSRIEHLVVDYENQEFSILEQFIKKGEKLVFINFSTLSIDKLFINQNLQSFVDVHKANFLSNINPLLFLINKMISAKWGRILFISSSRAIKGDIGISPYTSSKLALSGLSRVLSREYAKFNITSNVLNLGYFDSPLWQQIPKKKRTELLAQVPSKVMGQPQDLIPIFECLIESDYINGSEISVDGGL